MKLTNMLLALVAMLIAPFAALARALAPAGLDACNVQGTYTDAISRTAEGALAAHLLVANGTTAGTQVKLCTASLRPLGTVYDDAADTASVAVELLMGASTRIVIASKAIAAGVRVYATAGGKVTDAVVTGAYLVGESLTAASGDGKEFVIMPLSPVVNP
jgi:hypothetical protein